jgi:hypothetical protein
VQGGVHARVDSVFEQRESIARLALADEPSRRSSTLPLLYSFASAYQPITNHQWLPNLLLV